MMQGILFIDPACLQRVSHRRMRHRCELDLSALADHEHLGVAGVVRTYTIAVDFDYGKCGRRTDAQCQHSLVRLLETIHDGLAKVGPVADGLVHRRGDRLYSNFRGLGPGRLTAETIGQSDHAANGIDTD